MSEEIRNTKPWLPWAIAFSALVGLLLAVEYWDWYNIFAIPWTLIKGLFAIQSIDAFEKLASLEAVPLNDQVKILPEILLFFVIGPACWILGEIRSQKEQIKLKGLMWYAGVILVGIGLFAAIFGTADRLIRYQDTAAQIRGLSTTDELRSDLRKLARKAVELYYLPSEKGGGGQSFRAFSDSIGGKRPIRLTDLSSHIPSSNTFLLKDVQSDSSITIYGISSIEAGDPDFENANGDQGLLQLAIDVHPEDGLYDLNRKEANDGFQ